MLVVDDELLERFAALEAEVAKLKGQADKDWYDLNGVCAKFRLSKDKVKSRQWRLQNKFPFYQDGPYANVSYLGSEVEQWIHDRLGSRKCG